MLVDDLKSSGVKEAYVGEIPRSFLVKPPGLNQDLFDSFRKRVNKKVMICYTE